MIYLIRWAQKYSLLFFLMWTDLQIFILCELFLTETPLTTPLKSKSALAQHHPLLCEMCVAANHRMSHYCCATHIFALPLSGEMKWGGEVTPRAWALPNWHANRMETSSIAFTRLHDILKLCFLSKMCVFAAISTDFLLSVISCCHLLLICNRHSSEARVCEMVLWMKW